MKSIAILAVTVGSAVLCAHVASANQKAWRHLVYGVGVRVSMQTDELVSGKSGSVGMGNAALRTSTASGVSHYDEGMLSKGTITVDVIGLTPDNALAIQIAEEADNRKAPPVRIDVTADGILRIPPDQSLNVSQEEQTLLRMLARNFVSAQDLSAGKWSHQLPLGYANIDEQYRITGTQSDGDVAIAMEQTIKVPGAQGSESVFHGTIAYNSKYKVPRDVSLEGVTRREGVDHTETAVSNLTLDLLSDSFAVK